MITSNLKIMGKRDHAKEWTSKEIWEAQEIPWNKTLSLQAQIVVPLRLSDTSPKRRNINFGTSFHYFFLDSSNLLLIEFGKHFLKFNVGAWFENLPLTP